jgi:hypothetical protein
MPELICPMQPSCDVIPRLREDHARIAAKLTALDGDVQALQQEFDGLRTRFQANEDSDREAHAMLLEQMGVVVARVGSIDKLLDLHTTAEEGKFEQILAQLAQIHDKTQPLVTVYEDISGWVSINKAVVDSVKWILPLFVGIGMSYVFITK